MQEKFKAPASVLGIARNKVRRPTAIVIINTTASTRTRKTVGLAWLYTILFFIAINMLVFIGEMNADWLAYEYLFNSGGGWLSDQGRDHGFLFLNEAAKSYISYEAFRIIFGLYFLAFVTWFTRRWRPHLANDTYLWAYAGLLPLLIPKFTVQIREGLADTLILVAFTFLFERERNYCGIKALWPTILLLIAAATIHSGTLIFSGGLVIAYATYTLTKRFSQRYEALFPVLITVISAFLFLYFADWDSLLRTAAENVLGDLPEEQADTEFAKAAYWTVKCLAVLFLAWNVHITQFKQRIFSIFIRYAVYAILPALQLIVVYLIFSGYPKFIDSAAVRAYHTVFYVVFALASLTTKAKPTTALIALFLLVDEYRAMIALL